VSRILTTVLALAMAIGATGQSVPRSTVLSSPDRCGALASLDEQDAEIASARMIPPAPPGTVLANRFTGATVQVPLPGYCRVQGIVDPRKAADGTTYGIGFALALPDNWNGRLLYQGGSGFNGILNEPLAAEPSGQSALARGFAVISTDGGHQQGGNPLAFLDDQQAALDFAFNAVPTVTRLGKELAARFYGRAPHHTYSAGCSTGGREGMLAAERYPLLFDGVVAGSPAMKVWHSQLAAWNAQVAFNRIAPKGADGKLLPREAFSPSDQRLLHAAVAAKCDALDGLADGFVNDLAGCRFDPGALQCRGGKTASCLSEEQVAALRTAFGGPRDSQGNVVASGFPYDLGLLGEHVGNAASVLPSGVPTQFGPPPGALDLSVDKEIERIRGNPMAMLTDTSRWTDLGTFYRRGGKILFYHGASDPWFSVLDTIDYYERLTAANPGIDASRLYVVPGMAHCGGGGTELFDILTPLVDWVERGAVPEAIVARSKVKPEMSRPLCPWPRYARYKGNGDPMQASSFECRGN